LRPPTLGKSEVEVREAIGEASTGPGTARRTSALRRRIPFSAEPSRASHSTRSVRVG